MSTIKFRKGFSKFMIPIALLDCSTIDVIKKQPGRRQTIHTDRYQTLPDGSPVMVNIVVESDVIFLTKKIYAWSQQHFCKAMLPTLHNEKCIDQGDQNYLILYFSLQKFVQQTYRAGPSISERRQFPNDFIKSLS